MQFMIIPGLALCSNLLFVVAVSFMGEMLFKTCIWAVNINGAEWGSFITPLCRSSNSR